MFDSSKKKITLYDFLNEVLRLLDKHGLKVYKHLDVLDAHIKKLDELIEATEEQTKTMDEHIKNLSEHIRSITSNLDIFSLYPKEIVKYGKIFNSYSKKLDKYLIESKKFREVLSNYVKMISENNQALRDFSNSFQLYLKILYKLLYPLNFNDFKEELYNKYGIILEKIEKIKFIDKEGKFMRKNSCIEFNLYKNGNQNYLLEIKNFIDYELAEFLIYKSNIFREINNIDFKKIAVTLIINKESYKLLQDNDYEILYRFII